MDTSIDVMRACGGGSGPLWRQMLADVYDCEVSTIASKEGPALGVALLAGAGTGVYASVPEACSVAVKTKDTASADAERHAKYEAVYEIYRSLYPSLRDHYKSLSSL
jgi:xylulokinase